MRTRTPVLLSVLAAVAVAGAGCGGGEASSPSASEGTEAEIKTFMFEPDPIEVDAGTTVTWTNEDDILHTVTSAKRAPVRFDQRLDGAGTTAEVRFEEVGTYEYVCAVHDGMEGSVVVR